MPVIVWLIARVRQAREAVRGLRELGEEIMFLIAELSAATRAPIRRLCRVVIVATPYAVWLWHRLF